MFNTFFLKARPSACVRTYPCNVVEVHRDELEHWGVEIGLNDKLATLVGGVVEDGLKFVHDRHQFKFTL